MDISPGSDSIFTVRFAPAAGEIGLRTAMLSVSSNDPAVGSYSFAVQGEATSPDLIVSAPTVKIPGNSVLVGSVQKGVKIIVTNQSGRAREW